MNSYLARVKMILEQLENTMTHNLRQNRKTGQGCSSMIECLSTEHKALGSIHKFTEAGVGAGEQVGTQQRLREAKEEARQILAQTEILPSFLPDV